MSKAKVSKSNSFDTFFLLSGNDSASTSFLRNDSYKQHFFIDGDDVGHLCTVSDIIVVFFCVIRTYTGGLYE